MYPCKTLLLALLLLGTAAVEEKKNLKTILDLLIGISNGFYFENNEVSNATAKGPLTLRLAMSSPNRRHKINEKFPGGTPSSRLDCPLCDSSVFSYCSEKLLHDACCCLNPYEHKLPHQCKFADCSFLHANSCREHKLITACCCSKQL